MILTITPKEGYQTLRKSIGEDKLRAHYQNLPTEFKHISHGPPMID